MAITVDIKNGFTLQEVSEVIRSALALDERIAMQKKVRYENICKDFEAEYGISSDIFIEKFESGDLDERDDYFNWFAAKKSFDTWKKKLDILSGISI